MLADEPTANLDKENCINVLKCLKELNRTVIIATHDPLIIENCDTILNLEKNQYLTK